MAVCYPCVIKRTVEWWVLDTVLHIRNYELTGELSGRMQGQGSLAK